MSNDDEARPGPAPERLNLDEDDWREAIRKALKGGKPPEEGSSEGQEKEGDSE